MRVGLEATGVNDLKAGNWAANLDEFGDDLDDFDEDDFDDEFDDDFEEEDDDFDYGAQEFESESDQPGESDKEVEEK